MKSSSLGWIGIIRLGLVQAALGAIVALTTSTLNRVMVVEAAMPAMAPAALVAWHYAIQLSRPRWGYGSDMGSRRTPWIIGGMGVLALGGVIAADAAVIMAHAPLFGVIVGLAGFSLIGAGVGASGTSLLALMAVRVAEPRRAAAASITWIMMIVGIVISAGVGGALLQPYSDQRLAMVASGVSGIAFLITLVAVWKIEDPDGAAQPVQASSGPKPPFKAVVKEVWADPVARRFTIFIFVSMLAYSAQDLILEPFAGLVFGMTPGQSTQLSAVQHGGVLLGLVLVGLIGPRLAGGSKRWMRLGTVVGCLGSALALAVLASASLLKPAIPLAPAVFLLGFANGVFAVSAIGSMMGLAGAGQPSREGVRLGVWGAAQAVAFGLGGFLGAAGVDILRRVLTHTESAFIAVFAVEAIVFLAAGLLASRLDMGARPSAVSAAPVDGVQFGRAG